MCGTLADMIRATSITLRFHIFDDWKCNYVEWGTHPHLTMKLSQLQLPSGLRRLVNDRCELHWQHRHCPRAPLIFFLSATESNIYFLHFFIYQFHDLLALMRTVFDYLFLAGVCIGIEADSAQF